MTTRAIWGWLAAFMLSLPPFSPHAQVSANKPLHIVTAPQLPVFNALPVEARLQLDPCALPETLSDMYIRNDQYTFLTHIHSALCSVVVGSGGKAPHPIPNI